MEDKINKNKYLKQKNANPQHNININNENKEQDKIRNVENQIYQPNISKNSSNLNINYQNFQQEISEKYEPKILKNPMIRKNNNIVVPVIEKNNYLKKANSQNFEIFCENELNNHTNRKTCKVDQLKLI